MDAIKIFTKNLKKELETLMKTVRIYNQDIKIEVGIEKCVMFIMKRGERETTQEHLDRKKITNYLGIFEVNAIKQTNRKGKKMNKAKTTAKIS